jgi:hypothetical protein
MNDTDDDAGGDSSRFRVGGQGTRALVVVGAVIIARDHSLQKTEAVRTGARNNDDDCLENERTVTFFLWFVLIRVKRKSGSRKNNEKSTKRASSLFSFSVLYSSQQTLKNKVTTPTSLYLPPSICPSNNPKAKQVSINHLMAEDNPPIAQTDPAPVGNQLPIDTTTTTTTTTSSSSIDHGVDDHHDHQRPSPSNSTSATAIAELVPAAAAAKPNLSFAMEAYSEHVPVETHYGTNVDFPLALNGAVSSTVEGYSIYSNIKDGKVMSKGCGRMGTHNICVFGDYHSFAERLFFCFPATKLLSIFFLRPFVPMFAVECVFAHVPCVTALLACTTWNGTGGFFSLLHACYPRSICLWTLYFPTGFFESILPINHTHLSI